jgi:hypothetical protein
MIWIPVQLDAGKTLAQLVIPNNLTATESETIIAALWTLVTPSPLALAAPAIQTQPKSAPTSLTAKAPSVLAREERHVVDTATAAYYLNRRPQTLRTWACRENGPMRPLRINGRLAWPVSELRRCVELEISQLCS